MSDAKGDPEKSGKCEVDEMLRMLTGIGFDEACEIGLKEGEEALSRKLLVAARKKREEDNLFNPRKMFGRPK